MPDGTKFVVTKGGFFSSTILIVEGNQKGCAGVIPNEFGIRR